MTLKGILKATEKFVIDNSPGILTGLGVAGAVTTAILTGKATYSACGKIYRENERRLADGAQVDDVVDTREAVELVWKDYVPPAASLVVTVAAIIAANQIGSRRQAAIAAAFKISERMAEEYRERAVETLGAKQEQAMQEKLSADRIAQTPGSELIIIAGSEAVFFDEFSGRYFKAEMEAVKKAVNDINYEVNNSYYACLTDFYDKLGLPKTEVSDEFGWNTDELLDLRFSPVLMQDGRAAIAISFNKTPIRHFNRVN